MGLGLFFVLVSKVCSDRNKKIAIDRDFVNTKNFVIHEHCSRTDVLSMFFFFSRMLECRQTNLFKSKHDNVRTLLTKMTFAPEELAFIASDTVHKN